MIVPIKKIDTLFERATVGLNNAKKNPFIIEKITPLGFTEERIDFGIALLERTKKSVQLQLKLYGEQQDLTDQFNVKRSEAEHRYATFVQMIKRTHKNDVQIMKTLGLTGKRIRSFEGFLQQSTQLYENAINDDTIFAKIEPLVGTKDNLQAGFDLVGECIALNEKQEKKKGNAQDATEIRDSDLKELRIYMSNFTTACRSALKDRPQLLETLKIKAYSPNYKKKKKTNGTTDPTNPTDPTDPTDSTDPADPTTPTDPPSPPQTPIP